MKKNTKSARKILLSFFMSCALSASLTSSTVKKEESPKRKQIESAAFYLKKAKNSKIKIQVPNTKEILNILSLLENTSIKYNREELYIPKEKMAIFEFLKNNSKECVTTFDDLEKLTDQIIENSLQTLPKENRVFLTSDEIKNSQSGEIDLDFEWRNILKDALKLCFTTSSNQKEDFCRLKNTTIRKDKLSTNILGIYEEEYLEITIDLENCKRSYENTSKSLTFREYLTLTLAHEINHSREYICACRQEAGQINKTLEWYDVGSFLLEAAAESQLYDNALEQGKIFASDNFTYQKERESEVLLFLLAAFDQKEADEYYASVFDSNLNSFYSFFGLETKEEMYEFYKILYAMDTLHENTYMYDELLFEETIHNSMELKKEIGFAYKNAIFKETILDLINYNRTYKDLTLEENLYLYRFVKSYIVDDSYIIAKNDTTYFYEYDDSFVKINTEIEDLFYAFLRTYYRISNEELSLKISELPYFDFSDLYDTTKEDMKNISLNKLIQKFPLLKNIAWTYKTYEEELDFYEIEAIRNLKK